MRVSKNGVPILLNVRSCFREFGVTPADIKRAEADKRLHVDSYYLIKGDEKPLYLYDEIARLAERIGRHAPTGIR